MCCVKNAYMKIDVSSKSTFFTQTRTHAIDKDPANTPGTFAATRRVQRVDNSVVAQSTGKVVP